MKRYFKKHKNKKKKKKTHIISSNIIFLYIYKIMIEQ